MATNQLIINDFTARRNNIFMGTHRITELTPQQRADMAVHFAISNMRNIFPPAIRAQVPTVSELMSRLQFHNAIPALMTRTFNMPNNIPQPALQTIRELGVQAFGSGEALDYFLASQGIPDEQESTADQPPQGDESSGSNF